MGLKQDKIGERYKTNEGYIAIIVDYINKMEVYIIFEGFENIMKPKKVQMSNLTNKNVKNEFHKSVFNIGYLGQGEYKTRENGEKTKYYNYWHGAMQRCYDEKYKNKKHTYDEAYFNEYFYNFQNFGKWLDDNWYEIEGETMCLDKDILYKGNKEYAPDKCIFVPERINTLFCKCDKVRGDLPIGVYYKKANGKYCAQCSTLVDNKRRTKYLGSYDTPEEAFIVYKEFKEAHIKEIADEYKNKIPQRLYEAMYNWVVEIDD